MSTPIDSDAVHHGLNRDIGKYKDDKFVRCWNCGFICNLDRDPHFPIGSRVGDGITHPEVVEYDEDTVTYDGTDDEWENGTVSFDGYRSDFAVSSGCPLCGCLTYDK